MGGGGTTIHRDSGEREGGGMRENETYGTHQTHVKSDVAKIVQRLSEIRGDLQANERYALDAVASTLRKGKRVAGADIARLEILLERHGSK